MKPYPAPAHISGFDSEDDALISLRERGYIYPFVPEGESFFCAETNQRYKPAQVLIKEVYRFEGITDPDDMSVIYGLEAEDGTRGTLIDAYGANASPAVAAAISGTGTTYR